MTAARSWRRLWWLPTAVLLVGVIVAYSAPGVRLAQPLVDLQQRMLAPTRPPTGVLVVDIDQASLTALKSQLGPWPYKRDVYALVIEQLRELGARAIAIDLLLADAHEGDSALARALARGGAPVVLGAAGLRDAIDTAPPASASGPVPHAPAAPAERWPTIALPSETVWPAPTHMPRLGVITSPLDDDGTLRRLPLWHEVKGHRWPSLPLALWQAAHEGAAPPPWPLDAAGRVHVAFGGTAAVPQTIPFARLARVSREQESAAALAPLVRDRVVVIGSSAMLADNVLTVAGQVPGTSALATVYAALRDQTVLRPAAAWAQPVLLGIALVPALLLWRRGQPAVPRDVAHALAAAVAALAVIVALLSGLRMPVAPLAPAVMLALTVLLSLWTQQRWLDRQARRLEHERAMAAGASRAKSEFLAHVSHEMRTPMNALLGVAELLAETPLDDRQRAHVQIFRQAGQTLHVLINDLLDLAKIEAGRLELQSAPFAMRELLEHVMSMLQPRAQQKGLAFELHVDEDVPKGLLGDGQRLRQVLTNFLGNAIKFTASGSVTLTVKLEGAGWLRFDVSDTGIGIAPSKLEKVFEPFSQADGSITRIYGGTGLGLAISRNVAQMMGGRVEVKSTPGLGSVFSLVVPFTPAEPPPAPSASANLALRAPARVLLAEDNEVNVYVFQAFLQGEPVHVDVATNGPMALAMAQERAYDLIFMDVQMPGLDGLTVTRRLRAFEAEHGRARTPVVALTANAFASDVHDSAQAGCDRHLSKPFTKQQIQVAIAELALRSESPAPPAPTSAADAGQRVPGPGAAAAPPTAAALIDEAPAIARLGGDRALYERVRRHAGMFMEHWAEDFDLAQREGRSERVRALAHDLRSISATIGASALAEAAAALEGSIRQSPTAEPDAAAHAAVRELIPPVIVALSRPLET